MRKNKKVMCVLVAVICIFLLAACSETSENAASYDNPSVENEDMYSKCDTREEAELIALQELYSELLTKFSGNPSVNIDSTKYSIGSIENSGMYWNVKGQIYLYDSYGQPFSDYYPGTFDIKLRYGSGQVVESWIRKR